MTTINSKNDPSSMAPSLSMPRGSRRRQISRATFVPTSDTNTAPSASTSVTITTTITPSRSLRQAKMVALNSISASFQKTPRVATPAKSFSSKSCSNKEDASTTKNDAKVILATPTTKKVVISSKNKSTNSPSSATSTSLPRPKRNVVKKTFFSHIFSTPSITKKARSTRVTPNQGSSQKAVAVPPPEHFSCRKILVARDLNGGKKESAQPPTNAATAATAASQLRSLKVVTEIPLTPKTSFIVRLFAMIHHSHVVAPDICRWIQNGTAVEVHSKHPGLGSLLSHFFQHSRFLSLQRQMNNYGFLNLLKESPHKEDGTYTGRCVYAHAYFYDEADPDVLNDKIRYQGAKSPAKIGRILHKRPPPQFECDTLASAAAGSAKKKPRLSERVATCKSHSSAITPSKSISKGTDVVEYTPQSQRKRNSSKLSPLEKVVLVASAAITEHSREPFSLQTPPPVKKAMTKSAMRPTKKPSSRRAVGTAAFGFDPEIRTRIKATKRQKAAAATASDTQKTPLNCKSLKALMKLPVATPVARQQHQHDVASAPSSNLLGAHATSSSSPEHTDMFSAFLETPPSQKELSDANAADSPNLARSSSTKSSPDGFRVLFHAAQAVECSPMKMTTTGPEMNSQLFSPLPLGAATLPPPQRTPETIAANKTSSSEPSPIMSLVNMDFDSFRQAMDALQHA